MKHPQLDVPVTLSGTKEYCYRTPRFPGGFAVQVKIGEVAVDGVCTDLSEHGLGANLKQNLALGTGVELLFRLPNATATFRVPASVTHRKGSHHGFAFIGDPVAAPRDHAPLRLVKS